MSNEHYDQDEADNEDQLLDLSDIAPPRQQVRLAKDGPIFLLASPKEFGVRDQARLNQLQEQIKRLTGKKALNPDQAEQLSKLYAKVTRTVLREIDEDDVAQLSDSDQEALVMVFTARWADYIKGLIEAVGQEQALAMIGNPISES